MAGYIKGRTKNGLPHGGVEQATWRCRAGHMAVQGRPHGGVGLCIEHMPLLLCSGIKSEY